MKRNLIDASQLELEDKVVSIKRVTKVVKGGRNFRFTALVVVGDGNGHVGAGLGKAAEIPEAIRKGKEDAMKKLVTVARDENKSITHDFVGKYGSAEMLLKRAPEGTGACSPLCLRSRWRATSGWIRPTTSPCCPALTSSAALCRNPDGLQISASQHQL